MGSPRERLKCEYSPFPSKNAVLNTSDIVVKVKEATNSDAWGPSGTAMGEISDIMSSSPEERAQALAMIWERLREAPERWRKVYQLVTLRESH